MLILFLIFSVYPPCLFLRMLFFSHIGVVSHVFLVLPSIFHELDHLYLLFPAQIDLLNQFIMSLHQLFLQNRYIFLIKCAVRAIALLVARMISRHERIVMIFH